jgi:hypothetical protein
MPQVYAHREPAPIVREIAKYKVLFTREAIALFNQNWPCSRLRDRAYWFEFSHDGNLIDTDVPEQDDGLEALSLAADAWEFLNGETPAWLPT